MLWETKKKDKTKQNTHKKKTQNTKQRIKTPPKKQTNKQKQKQNKKEEKHSAYLKSSHKPTQEETLTAIQNIPFSPDFASKVTT